MTIVGVDHIQLAMPAGGEDQARAFYGGLLGLGEIGKPLELRSRGGVWFRCGTIELHLGVDRSFHPARKAHPAFLVEEFDDLVRRLRGASHNVAVEVDPLGRRRIYVADPFGNRLELITS